MLSPHEFATLMMIKDAPDQIAPDRAELHTLLEQDFVSRLVIEGNRWVLEYRTQRWGLQWSSRGG